MFFDLSDGESLLRFLIEGNQRKSAGFGRRFSLQQWITAGSSFPLPGELSLSAAVQIGGLLDFLCRQIVNAAWRVIGTGVLESDPNLIFQRN